MDIRSLSTQLINEDSDLSQVVEELFRPHLKDKFFKNKELFLDAWNQAVLNAALEILNEEEREEVELLSHVKDKEDELEQLEKNDIVYTVSTSDTNLVTTIEKTDSIDESKLDKLIEDLKVDKLELIQAWGGDTWEEGIKHQAEAFINPPNNEPMGTTLINQFNLSNLPENNQKHLQENIKTKCDEFANRIGEIGTTAFKHALILQLELVGLLKDVELLVNQEYKQLNETRLQDNKPVLDIPEKLKVSAITQFVNVDTADNVRQFSDNVNKFFNLYFINRLIDRANEIKANKHLQEINLSIQPNTDYYDPDRNSFYAVNLNHHSALDFLKNCSPREFELTQERNLIIFKIEGKTAFLYDINSNIFRSYSYEPKNLAMMTHLACKVFQGDTLKIKYDNDLAKEIVLDQTSELKLVTPQFEKTKFSSEPNSSQILQQEHHSQEYKSSFGSHR